MHPLSGTWVANVAESRRHANHQFEKATMTFTIDDGEVVLAYEGINASGKHEASTQTIHADGREHAIPEAPASRLSARWASGALNRWARKTARSSAAVPTRCPRMGRP
jgi:hypothetical protein